MSKKSNKAGKKKDSAANKAYKLYNKQSINKDKRAKREAKKVEWKAKHPPKVKRGTARYFKRHGTLDGFSVRSQMNSTR